MALEPTVVRFWVTDEIFVRPVPLSVNVTTDGMKGAGPCVIVKALAPLLKVMSATSMFV